jgi:uncharacterized cupin superfamily protein
VVQRITDVERLKNKARKMAAGRVLAGEPADFCLDLARSASFRARIAAGYGSLTEAAQTIRTDRLIWILDGHAELQSADGATTYLSQGESTVLKAGSAFRLVFPQLSIYLRIEARGTD